MNFKVLYNGEEKSFQGFEGETILKAFNRLGITGVHTPCGGLGWCKKCLVKIVGVAEPVLACRTMIKDGMIIKLTDADRARVLESGEKADIYADGQTGVGIAVDIGTTTLVCRMTDMVSGQTIMSQSRMNPQVSYGGDVISRISAAQENLSQLKNVITAAISGSIDKMMTSAKIDKSSLRAMSVAGNTVMCHIFAGISPESIGVYPFAPQTLFGNEYSSESLGFDFDVPVYILPGISGFIGGDITGGILASGMDSTDETQLMVDIGTNGEIVLRAEERLICASAAAGPALEGAQIECGMTATDGAITHIGMKHGEIALQTIGDVPKGLCGSGVVDALAFLINIGAVDSAGQLKPEDEFGGFKDRFSGDGTRFYFTDKVYLSQRDIRALQLSKAAIAAGIDTCIKSSGINIESVKKLKVAGGFGSGLDMKSCGTVGMFPKSLVSKAVFIGNTAIEGAAVALVSKPARERLAEISRKAEYIELSTSDYFTKSYMENMRF